MSLQEQYGPLMKFKEVSRTCRRARTAIYGDIAKGRFPRPVKTGMRAVAWRTEEIERWIAGRPAA